MRIIADTAGNGVPVIATIDAEPLEERAQRLGDVRLSLGLSTVYLSEVEARRIILTLTHATDALHPGDPTADPEPVGVLG